MASRRSIDSPASSSISPIRFPLNPASINTRQFSDIRSEQFPRLLLPRILNRRAISQGKTETGRDKRKKIKEQLNPRPSAPNLSTRPAPAPAIPPRRKLPRVPETVAPHSEHGFPDWRPSDCNSARNSPNSSRAEQNVDSKPRSARKVDCRAD